MALADALGVAGLSVTAPFKESILDHVRHVDALGRRVGAVNTVRADHDSWVGLNTDVPGFLAPLAARGDVSGVRSSVLGAGGAARAVAVALASRGAEVTVCARRPERAAVVARLVGGTVGTLPPRPESWDLLVNTTPMGTAPGVTETPVPAASLCKGKTVYDLVYNPGRTRLLREAATAGCETIGGLDMLVAQAVRQFRVVVRGAPVGRALQGGGAGRPGGGAICMSHTLFETFQELATRGTFVPVCKEIRADLLTPLSAFLKVAEHADHAFLFESVEGGEQVARYSFLGKDPFLVLRARDGLTLVEQDGVTATEDVPFMDRLRGLMSDYRAPVVPGLPRFTGGAVGFLGYDAASWFEPSLDAVWSERNAPSSGDDDAGFMVFDTILAFDHVKHRILIIANARVDPGADLETAYRFACAKIRFLEQELERSLSEPAGGPGTPLQVRSNTSQEAFEQAVLAAKDHITAGDVYQVVLSQRFETSVAADPFTVYRALRHVNPSPYMYFIRMGSSSIVGASPEMLVRGRGAACRHPPDRRHAAARTRRCGR